MLFSFGWETFPTGIAKRKLEPNFSERRHKGTYERAMPKLGLVAGQDCSHQSLERTWQFLAQNDQHFENEQSKSRSNPYLGALCPQNTNFQSYGQWVPGPIVFRETLLDPFKVWHMHPRLKITTENRYKWVNEVSLGDCTRALDENVCEVVKYKYTVTTA